MWNRKSTRFVFKLSAALLAGTVTLSCAEEDRLSLTVEVNNRAMSKVPYFIAWDQELYEKHGLKVELIVSPPTDEVGNVIQPTDFWTATKMRLGITTFTEGGKIVEPTDVWTKIKRRIGMEKLEIDIFSPGGTPLMLRAIREAPAPYNITIGSTDCAVRTHVIGRKGLEIESLEDLKRMRLGGGSRNSTTGFQVFLFAQRMGWNLGQDFIFVDLRETGIEELEAGEVDAVFVNERAYSTAVDQGYPVLFDTAEWNEQVAGNSMAVSPEWLEDGTNREAARRFIMAIAEAISLYHTDRDLALRTIGQWSGRHGVSAERIYERGAWLPRKPYPCVAGFRKTAELYDSPEVSQHEPEEFYDDSIVRQIDATGFFDRLYQ